ncbi:MAG: CBS domain-containing protein [Pseudolabrys sp.]|nr:CBS domain-containing protein [Pseudolabrys sp.]MBV9956287.1 CBS domain-containing protein [Pseudolabrys sp.]
MTVTSILSVKGRDVVSIEPTADLDTAAKLLAARRIGAVVVLGADDRLVGILSERDIVKAFAERGTAALKEPVSQIMTRNVATCSEDESIASLMERMTSGKFRHMPVLKGTRLVGVVSIGDVVKDRLAMMEQETEAMRDYIRSA